MRLGMALLAILLAGCDPLCSTDVVHVVRDPRSDRYAVTEVRNCGATTDFATVVRVGRASQSQSSAETVFVADSNHGAAAVGPKGTIWTDVSWTGPMALRVRYASAARVFKSLPASGGVSVQYVASGPAKH